MTDNVGLKLTAIDGGVISKAFAGKAVPGFEILDPRLKALVARKNPHYQPDEELVTRFIRIIKREFHRDWRYFRQDYEPRESILAIGEGGTGKTEFFRYMSACLNLPMINCDPSEEPGGLVYSMTMEQGTTRPVLGAMGRGMDYGIPTVINELNTIQANRLLGFNGAIQDGECIIEGASPDDTRFEDGVLKAKRGFMTIATINPHAGMGGSIHNKGIYELPEVTERRFLHAFEFHPMSRGEEAKVIKAALPETKASLINTVTSFAQRFRKGGNGKLLSVPQLINWIRVINWTLEADPSADKSDIAIAAFNQTIAGKWPADVRTFAMQALKEEAAKASDAGGP